LQLQADTQTTVTTLCLAGLHVLDKKIKPNEKVGKIKTVNKRDKNKKNVKRFSTSIVRTAA